MSAVGVQSVSAASKNLKEKSLTFFLDYAKNREVSRQNVARK
jgi:hypothetical protein